METATEPSKTRRVRFGPFELRTDTRELTKSGIQLNLQAKPEQILEVLISRPGVLVKREELRQSLWQENVFVDFESGLNTAINRLRAALGDTAGTPRYVETIPRLGYRFICPVQDVTEVDSSDRAETFDPPLQARKSVYSGALFDNLFWKLSLAVVLAWVCQFLFFAVHLSGSAAVLHACFSN